MAEIDKNKKNWLVKSSTKILGPYSAIEIAQGIVKKHISIIDEARMPNTLWHYIRENSIFSEVVQSLRHEQSNHVEETVNTAQNTQTLSRTDWANADGATPTPFLNDSGGVDKDSTRIKDVTPGQNNSQGSTFGTGPKNSNSAPSFGAATDQRVQAEIETKSRGQSFFIWAATLILAIVVAMVGYRKINNEGKGYDKSIREAQRYNHIFLYEKAVDYFHRAQEVREPDQASSFPLALSVLQADRHSLWARKVFETELAKPTITRQDNSDAYIGIGLSYVIDGDSKMAQDSFNKALATDPGNAPANINLGFNYIKNGDYGLAAKSFGSMVPSSAYHPYTLFGASILAAESQNYSHKEVQKELREYIQKPQALRKEIGLVLAFLQMTDKNVDGLDATMMALVSLPIKESADFAFDPRIDRRVIDWEYLERYCAKIFEQSGASALGKSFRAMCLLEQNRDVEAKKWIDEALAQEPKNTMANLTYVHFLMKSRRLQEAATLLKSPELESLGLTPLLLGKVCQELNDSPCALENFKKAYMLDNNDVTRIHPWARANFGKNKDQLAQTWELIKKGLDLEPQYKPLIELRDQLENQ